VNLENSFFIGIAGSGMSALAQYLAMQGFKVSGSDRSLKSFLKSPKSKSFTKLKIQLFPQDTTGLTTRHTCIIRSTAIEEEHPEIVKAKELGVPIVSRSELLARVVNSKKSIAISGTSGKSSVTAMLFTILESAGLDPSIITGAGLLKFLDVFFNGGGSNYAGMPGSQPGRVLGK